ncbi:MAG TPA: uroporphyrinogen decarboxylase family protein [Oscillospiraceae bacterium]|nr:uroporphyrinogen decarboxylase family protein [Oscillospiraceae bacterium]HPF55123.1 uroporphyrinogen decarboxylase family protein [Clostridiales bacterium]HPK34559.1 uroporphyrinogen decarboxylase family protein [Oscillospiraceae bacterium]HPR74787.1 uroporphyrinogen decarboxylase family protein [Oscillospiraceae bacterium]
MKLTSRERIMRIFRNEEIDKPALKLWGFEPNLKLLNPAYRPVIETAAEKTDWFVNAVSSMNIYCGKYAGQLIEREYYETDQPIWRDLHTTFHTPKGDLHGVQRFSTVGEPSYMMEYMIKEPEDLDKLLSMPYEEDDYDAAPFYEKKAMVGERGVVMTYLDHAGYALQRITGSENLAYFSVDCREKVDEVIGVFGKRVLSYAKKILAAGVIEPFMWVGPELFTPPLLSPKDFDDFVFKYDKTVCDAIHNAGANVWVHCHGKVAELVGRYIEMGVDILNPLEPPKNGDINLKKIVEQYGNRIGWEGNIEIQDILQAQPKHLKTLIDECVEAGNRSGRFVLCPSAGFMEYPRPSKEYIDNLLLYLNYGFERVEACRRG